MSSKLLLILILILSACNTPPKDCGQKDIYTQPCEDIDYEKFEEFKRRARPIRGDNW